MNEKRTTKKMLYWKLIGRRIRGRARKTWFAEYMEDDAEKMEKDK